MKATWISAETERKEQHFRGLLGGIHIPICANIRKKKGRPSDPPYLFIDLHGGPGHLEYNGRVFPGSPIIALEELAKRPELPYQTIHFEQEPTTAARLASAVRLTGAYATTVQPQRFEDGVQQLVRETGAQPFRFGLAYSDPIKDPIPVDTFNLIAQHFKRIDLLAYVAATDQYKRANANGQGHGRRLADDIAAIDKKTVLVRSPTTAHHWTFILWTNWTDFPAWTKAGFHNTESARGRSIIEQLNYTETERRERANTPLPFDQEPPYRSYREYLKHPKFLVVRAEVFKRAGGLCEQCGVRPPTEPHHLRYPPWGTFDVPENMIAVCHPCHCDIHGKAA